MPHPRAECGARTIRCIPAWVCCASGEHGSRRRTGAVRAVTLDATCAAYRDAVLALPDVVEWAGLAAAEPEDLVELEAEF